MNEQLAHRPFDVTTIEADIAQEVRSYAPRRDRKASTTPLRRLVDQADSEGFEQRQGDAEKVDQEPRTENAGKALIAERQTTHGNFEDNARVSQYIKRAFRNESGWHSLTDVEREAMDMIALKFSRILSGRSLQKQHWEDVVGYAQLALNQCLAEKS